MGEAMKALKGQGNPQLLNQLLDERLGWYPARVTYRFESELWRHDGDAAWHFVTLPFDVADDIEERHGRTAGGFGSVRVRVRVGATEWTTSLFPDSKRKSYVLPVKAAVRKAEHLADGTPVDVELNVVTD